MSLQFSYTKANRVNASGMPYANASAYFYAQATLNNQQFESWELLEYKRD